MKWTEHLSARQALEKMLQREAGAREIAERLYIGEGTVKTHLHNIYEKLNVASPLALLRYAQEKGLFDDFFSQYPPPTIIPGLTSFSQSEGI